MGTKQMAVSVFKDKIVVEAQGSHILRHLLQVQHVGGLLICITVKWGNKKQEVLLLLCELVPHDLPNQPVDVAGIQKRACIHVTFQLQPQSRNPALSVAAHRADLLR